MITKQEKRALIIKQYFLQYLERIQPTLEIYNNLITQYPNGELDITHTMLLCSIMDYFGKIMRCSKRRLATNNINNNEKNFKFFIGTYFPKKDCCKGDVVYKLFRNGVMHQYYPKACGIFWSNDNAHHDLIEDNNGNPRLNNYVLSIYIQNALKNISDIDDIQVENIHINLIKNNYGFNDSIELHNLIQSYKARGKTFYNSCI